MNEKFGNILRLVAWLDHARWHSEDIMMSGLLNIDKFRQLSDDQKILVHWLCYITDRMRPFEPVWEIGGQIFSEVINKYASDETQNENDLMEKIFGRLNGFMEAPTRGAIIDLFKSREKTNFQKFATRYQDDLYSIARTLTVLLDYEKNIINFLLSKRNFWSNGNDNLGKMAYLLYLLTYKDVNKDFPNFENNNRQSFLNGVSQYKSVLNNGLTTGYDNWNKSGRFGAKRLWAALRDYVKPGSPLRESFIKSFGEDQQQLLSQDSLFSLEFPGDVWNIRFSNALLKPLFKDKKVNNRKVFVKNASQMMRRIFETLSIEEKNGYYPEQFDISFDFAPRMCEKKMEGFCLFRDGGAKRICWKWQFPQTERNLLEKKVCPVVLISCGYVFKCEPIDCPIGEGKNNNLCNGCRSNSV